MEVQSFEIIKALGLIAGFGIAAQWLAWRYRIPSIFLLTLFWIFHWSNFRMVKTACNLWKLLLPYY